MELQERGSRFYAVGRICGRLHRVSTGIRVGGRQAKEKARARLVEIEKELREAAEAGTPINNGTAAPSLLYPTFAEWWATYQGTYGQRKAASTQERERSLIKPALALWGHRALDDLREVDGERYLVTRRAAVRGLREATPQLVSPSTIAREAALLSTVFGKARANYPDLPVVLHAPRYRYPVRERVVTQEEQGEWLRRLPVTYHRFALVLFGTGVRLAEALGLDPDADIDYVQCFIRVVGKGSKVRRVPLFPAVAALLRAETAERPRLWQDWKDATVSQAFARACAARRAWRGRPAIAAMPRITPHTLRHTFGWRWLTGNGDRSKRGDLYTLSRILGHGSVQITERHYAHLFDQDLKDAMLGVDVGVSSESVKPWVGPDAGGDHSVSH